MFSALTSDLRKVCGETHAHTAARSETPRQAAPELAEHRSGARQVECSSPWSSGLRRGPPAACRRTRPSSALCSPGRTPRLGFLGGWCCCLRSHVQTCSVLQRGQDTSTAIYQQANTEWQPTKSRCSLYKHTVTHGHAGVTGNAGGFLPPSDTAWLCSRRQRRGNTKILLRPSKSTLCRYNSSCVPMFNLFRYKTHENWKTNDSMHCWGPQTEHVKTQANILELLRRLQLFTFSFSTSATI